MSSSQSPISKFYLVAYNVVSLYGWAYCLNLAVPSLAAGQVGDAWKLSGEMVKWVQTLALLEIVHALLGLVRSSISTTIMQVASRLLLVWAILENFTAVRSHPAYASMLVAWSVTEMVRYAYYGFNLLGSAPEWITWCRYTFFFVLYPLGAGSEWILMYHSLDAAKAIHPNFYYGLIFILVMYVPGFYILYSHMIKQRTKFLGGSSGGGGGSQNKKTRVSKKAE